MALTGRFPARIYGQVFGTPPFQNASGASAVDNIKSYPAPPLTSLPANCSLWPLPNGLQVGNFYCYTIIQVPPTGLNVNGANLATDSTVTQIVANGS